MLPLSPIFKAYDIRGTTPDQLDAEVCRAVGAAFARFAAAPRICVARDMRDTGLALSHAFAEGAMAQGVDVIDLGLASTDLIYFASGKLDCPGALFTASHNPAKYNGIKLCLAGAKPVGEDSGLREMQAAIEAGIPAGPGGGTRTERDMLEAFAQHVLSFVDRDSLKPLKVVADTANGMGGLVVPKVFDHLPFDLEIMYGELDGSFPNHPADPIQPENQRDLMARVLETGADIGLAFDGDADRAFIVDEKGKGISGSTTTAIVAKSMLAKHPGSKIIYNLICSKAVPEIVRENGGEPIRTRVGHSFIKAIMAESGAVFGGEHSGHYYFRDNYRADSGLITVLVVLELLCASGQPLSELRKPFERYAASGEINTKVADPHAVVERLAARFASDEAVTIDLLDGLTVDHAGSGGAAWWFNIRPSNTEPLLRLNLEAATVAECELHTSAILNLITAP